MRTPAATAVPRSSASESFPSGWGRNGSPWWCPSARALPFHALVLVTLGAAATGCGKHQTETVPPAPPAVSLPAATTVATKATTVGEANAHAANVADCPSAVAGASTKVKDIPAGVELTITAKKTKATREIRARATKLAKFQPGGSGRGAAAVCVVHYFAGAETTVEPIRRGVRVTIHAITPQAVEGLRKMTRDRAESIAKRMVSTSGSDRSRTATPAAHGVPAPSRQIL